MSGSRNVAILFIFGLALGVGGSYLFMNNQMQTLIQDYESQFFKLQEVIDLTTDQKETEISDLETIVEDVQNTVASLQNQNVEYKSEISILKDDVRSLEVQMSSKNIKIDNLEAEIDSIELQLWSKDSDISYLEGQIEDILDLDITQHYEWEYGWSDWSWDLTIPLELYWEYCNKNRPKEWENWVSMCKDPKDDYYINQLVDSFERTASDKGYSEYETVEYVITFIQSLPYTVDDETTPWNEYPRYPVETLFDRGGDCEDSSILTATFLYEMGYDVALLILEEDNHVAVGIAGGEGIYGTYYSVDDVKYFFIETTGDGWKIGDQPSSVESGLAYVYPLND